MRTAPRSSQIYPYISYGRPRLQPYTEVATTGSVAAETAARIAADNTLQANINLKANIASPTFTGDPKAPTPTPGDNDTSVATTAFVQSAIASVGAGMNQLTGDVTAGPGSGSQAATLATVNATVGTFTSHTVNAKGLTTAAGNLTGDVTTSGAAATIAPGVVTYAKQQNVAAARLIGNPTGSPAAHSEVSLGTGLAFAGTVLNGAVGTLTGVTAGTGLTGGGTTGTPTVSLTVPVTVANGGTNATTLPITAAGFGLTQTLLRSNGTTVAPISAADGTVGTAVSGCTLYPIGLGAPGAINMGRANGTFAALTAVLSGQAIGTLQYDGTYAANWNAASRALIQCLATENWTSTANGTSFVFQTTGAGTLVAANVATLRNSGCTFVGTNTNDNAAAGYVGQYIESNIAAATPTNAATSGAGFNVTSISLTAGDWDVWGSVLAVPAATTSYTDLWGGISTTTAAFPDASRMMKFHQPATVNVANGYAVPCQRISISATTTVYLVALSVFTVSTMGVAGTISARRVR